MDIQFNPVQFEEHMEMMSKREAELNAQGIKVFRVSATETDEFMDCRRRWDLSSYSRQALEPKKPHNALSFGTAIHYALEMLYSGRKANVSVNSAKVFADYWQNTVMETIYSMQKLEVPESDLTIEEQFEVALLKLEYDDEAKEYRELLDLGQDMLRGYEIWSSKEDYHGENCFMDVLYTEKEFAVIINDAQGNPYHYVDFEGQKWELWLVGRLDMVVRDWDGQIWILDHKTSKDRLIPENLVLDDQMSKYIWAAQEILGQPVAGAYYNVLRKKLPRVPKVLVSGKGLSKDKSIDTTYEVYYQAILDNDFNPEDYEGILDILQNKNAGFFERKKVRRNQMEVMTTGYYLLQTTIDMLNAPFIYPHFTWDCKWKCDFKELCLAMNRGDDVDWYRENCFQKRKPETQSVYKRESTIE